ncbi:MAG TPA: hypothetical protein V6D47_05810 [Oscillatoriaceae cyanobacterium]
MEKVRSLLEALKADEYVRFKHGKALDAALKELEAQSALDAQALEARLLEMLELVRGKKGAPASPSSKSKRAKQPAATA